METITIDIDEWLRLKAGEQTLQEVQKQLSEARLLLAAFYEPGRYANRHTPSGNPRCDYCLYTHPQHTEDCPRDEARRWLEGKL